MVEIKKMKKTHIEKVCEIENICIKHPWNKKSFEEELLNECAVCRVLFEDGVLCAFICARNIIGETDIDEIATHPDFRRKGYAAMLLKNVTEETKRLGGYAMHLEVRRSNAAAIALYEKIGFKKVGERKRYYSDNGEDALLMTMRW